MRPIAHAQLTIGPIIIVNWVNFGKQIGRPIQHWRGNRHRHLARDAPSRTWRKCFSVSVNGPAVSPTPTMLTQIHSTLCEHGLLPVKSDGTVPPHASAYASRRNDRLLGSHLHFLPARLLPTNIRADIRKCVGFTILTGRRLRGTWRKDSRLSVAFSAADS
jgi:hypothetical protein